jgi:hypothetical protein
MEGRGGPRRALAGQKSGNFPYTVESIGISPVLQGALTSA